MALTFSEWRRDNSGTRADYLAETAMRGDYAPTEAAADPEYRVIYRFGRTEVAGIGTYETREEAEAEACEADDEGLDETWVEEVPPS